MQIQRMGDAKLKVMLNREDLKEYGITFDSLSYSDSHTKQVMLHLLDLAFDQTGFCADGQKLFIEVFPTTQQGCVIYFTPLFRKTASTRRYRVKRTIGEAAVYRFSQIDTVIEASVKLFSQMGHRVYKSSLYALGEDYFLAVYPLDGIQGRAASFLSEYGRLAGRGNLYVTYLQEHGDTIVENRAIDTISYYLA